MSKSPYAYTVVKPSEMPVSRFGRTSGKWDWLRQVILNELRPDGDPLRVIVPNRKEANLLQAAAQNCSSTREGKPRRSRLPSPFKVLTATKQVSDDKEQVYVYVRVIDPTT